MIKPVIILACSFLVGLLFNLIPVSNPANYFLFGGVEISLKTHAYFACDHISRMLLFWALMWLPIKGIQVLFWVEFIDLIDYLVCYNGTWFNLLGYSVEYNDFKITIVIIFTVQTIWKYLQSKYSL